MSDLDVAAWVRDKVETDIDDVIEELQSIIDEAERAAAQKAWLEACEQCSFVCGLGGYELEIPDNPYEKKGGTDERL